MFGFVARFQVVAALDDAAETRLTDDFLRLLEARGLVTSGGFSGTRWSHVIRSDASQATDADRQAVDAWAASRAEIVSREVGDVVDLETVYG